MWKLNHWYHEYVTNYRKTNCQRNCIRIIGSQNIPSWKGPTRITESSTWLHAGPKTQTLCLSALFPMLSELWQLRAVPTTLRWRPFSISIPSRRYLQPHTCALAAVSRYQGDFWNEKTHPETAACWTRHWNRLKSLAFGFAALLRLPLPTQVPSPLSFLLPPGRFAKGSVAENTTAATITLIIPLGPSSLAHSSWSKPSFCRALRNVWDVPHQNPTPGHIHRWLSSCLPLPLHHRTVKEDLHDHQCPTANPPPPCSLLELWNHYGLKRPPR